MPYEVYKLIHLLGVFTIITALAATGMHALQGGTRLENPYRRALGAAHGIAAFLIILGGFGMLARLGAMHGALPGWVFLKLALWLALSIAMVLPYRRRAYARLLLIALPLLTVLGGAIALYKPF